MKSTASCVFGALAIPLGACGSQSPGSGTGGTGRFTLDITDAPIDGAGVVTADLGP